jgi:hypothetical protein
VTPVQRRFLALLVIAVILLVVAQLLGACGIPAPRGPVTAVTFTFETYDTRQRQVNFPVDASFTMPDVYAMSSGPGRATPWSYSVSSREHPSAARDIEVSAHVVGPPGTLVVCTWVAQTPAGTRSSEHSRGGEGSAAVPDGGTEAIARCKYEA